MASLPCPPQALNRFKVAGVSECQPENHAFLVFSNARLSGSDATNEIQGSIRPAVW